jgi:hypothetical protein
VKKGFLFKKDCLMKKIEISDEVWQAIAKRGKFGETEEDVLRRVFELPPVTEVDTRSSGRSATVRSTGVPRRSFATVRMHAGVHRAGSEEHLVVSFHDGKEQRYPLPSKDDKDAIRSVRDEAVAFALSHGASNPGQTNAVRKALTDAGYFVSR